MTAVLVNC